MLTKMDNGGYTFKKNPMEMMTGVPIVILIILTIINIFLMIDGKRVPFTSLYDIFWVAFASWIFYIGVCQDIGVKECVKENKILVISLGCFAIFSLALGLTDLIATELQGGLNKECSSRSPNINIYESLMANNGKFKEIMIVRFVVITLFILFMIMLMILFYFRNSYTGYFYNIIQTNQYGFGWIMIAIISGLGIYNISLSPSIQSAYDSERVC